MNTAIAGNYYAAMANKNVAEVGLYLHPAVHFKSPLNELSGKEAVLSAVTTFMTYFKALTVRAVFEDGPQAVVIYDLDFPLPLGKQSSAAYLRIDNGLIVSIELLFDARSYVK